MTPTTPERVLIVDDEPALLKIISLYMRRMGYEITTAETTEKAWEEVQRAPDQFRLAVVDASMEGLRTDDLVLRMTGASQAVSVTGE